MGSFAEGTRITNLKAGSSLTASQYKAVKVSSDGEVDVCGANVAALGFLMNAPATGSICEIATLGGGAKAIAGGTITAGDLLATDSNGDVLVAAAGDTYVALALESAVDNDIFQVMPVSPVSVASSAQLFTASGAVTSGKKSIQLAHASVVIAATIANAANHAGLFVVKNTSASGTAAHTLTLTAGTFNGTNNVATLNAPNECLVVWFDTLGNGTIVENVGSVALS